MYKVSGIPEKFQEMEPAARAVRIKAAYFALDCEKSRNKLEKALTGDNRNMGLFLFLERFEIAIKDLILP